MFRRFLIIASLLIVVATPTLVSAAPSFLPIVQCGGTNYDGSVQPPCSPCQLFKVADNFKNLILEGIVGPVAAFMFVVSGAMMLLGAGSTKLQGEARTLMTNTALGVAIILFAWVGTNFLIKAIGNGNTSDRWYEFTCPKYLQDITLAQGEAPAVPPAQALNQAPQSYNINTANLTDAQLRQIAQDHANAKFPAQNSPTLNTLIDCVMSDPIVAALAVARSGLFTYEQTNKVCNYTRGEQIGVGACQHSLNSCHYGGSTGTNGAEAADINAKGGFVTISGVVDDKGKAIPVAADEGTLFCQLERVYNSKKCGTFKFLNWEPADGGNGHSHLSTSACTMDGVGISGSAGKQKLLPPDCANSFRLPQTSITGQ